MITTAFDPGCGENSESDRNNTESLTVHPELENSLDPHRTLTPLMEDEHCSLNTQREKRWYAMGLA